MVVRAAAEGLNLRTAPDAVLAEVPIDKGPLEASVWLHSRPSLLPPPADAWASSAQCDGALAAAAPRTIWELLEVWAALVPAEEPAPLVAAATPLEQVH